jgi:hypothetical protein
LIRLSSVSVSDGSQPAEPETLVTLWPYWHALRCGAPHRGFVRSLQAPNWRVPLKRRFVRVLEFSSSNSGIAGHSCLGGSDRLHLNVEAGL